MADQDAKIGPKPNARREEKLAAALRANLKRRKAGDSDSGSGEGERGPRQGG